MREKSGCIPFQFRFVPGSPSLPRHKVEFHRPPLLARSTPDPVVGRNRPPPHSRRFCREYPFHSPHKQDPLSNSIPLACPLKYLGRLVDKHGVRPDPEAVEAVLTWKAPKTGTQLMTFLGFANYYREFIKGYADKIYPMQRLMRNKGKKFTWTDEAQVSFENIKRELCEAPVFGMPTEKGMFVLDTDASVVAISGILHQEQ